MTTQFRESLRAMGLAPAEALGNILEQQCSSGARLFSLAQWMEEPSLLQQQLLTETPHGSDRLLSRARNSVLVQDFALNIIGPLTLRLFKDGEVSIPSPAEIFFLSNKEQQQPARRWCSAASEVPSDESGFITSIGDLIDSLYPLCRRFLRVGPAAYWSSIGLGLSAPFSAFWNQAEPGVLCRLGNEWLNQFKKEPGRFLCWIPVAIEEEIAAIPQRRGCCLRYVLPGGTLCGTCGLHRQKRLEFMPEVAYRLSRG